MLIRQKAMLRLLASGGGNYNRLELMKLCFLLQKEGRSDNLKTFYEFVPYLYGPHSFTLSHELQNLEKEGLIQLNDPEIVSLTAKGIKRAGEPLATSLVIDLVNLKKKYGKLDQNSLISEVYKNHPWFTLNSKFPQKRKAKFQAAQPANYTIGYQSFQVDGLFNHLLEKGVRRIFDTRSNPISRRFGFHKSTLGRISEKLGIEYEHVPELGVPSDWRQDLVTDSEYRELFEKYETVILAREKKLLKLLAEKMTSLPSVLLCREASERNCHRSILSSKLKWLNGLEVIDISSETSQRKLF